jgi:hypothetical protein
MPTISERYFKEWCCLNHIKWRPIRKARVDSHKRPDFAIKVGGHWCVVEVKQIDLNPQDKEQLQRAFEKREGGAAWKRSPGYRLLRGLRHAESQLHKFSMRGLPTVVCFFDTTIGFFDTPREVIQAMRRVNTHIISAVAVLRRPAANWVVDLFHYPSARIPIPANCADSLVRKNIIPDCEDQH